jgi:cytoskeleton protein RodZ
MALRRRQRLKFMSGEGAGDERENGDSTARLSVGMLLRSERERRNLTIDDVAANLRIRRSLIDAIEHGRFKELPGAPYAVGFIRTYAEFLDLDRDEVIRRFRGEAEGIENHKELVFPRPLSESRLPGGVLLLMSAVIAACAYAFWHFYSADDRTPMPRVASVPERLAPLVDAVPPRETQASAAETAARPAAPSPQPRLAEAPAAAPASPPAAAAEPVVTKTETPAPVSTQEPAATPAHVIAAAPSAPPPAPAPAAEASAIPAAPVDASAQPRVFGETGEYRVVIRATADSWIQVRDASGTVVFTRVMRAGDSYNVPNRPGLSLYTGSAGALEISVDGKVAPSVGQHGAVRRDVLLDPDRLLAGTAVLDQKRPSSADPAVSRPAAASSSIGGQ